MGKYLFLPNIKIESNNLHYSVLTSYGEYKCFKGGDTVVKPKRCSYWYHNPSLVVANELSRLLDYLAPNQVSTRFNSSLASGHCSLVAGADQGQGAWRSWIKIVTYGGKEIRECLGKDMSFDPKTTYIISQVVHFTCKKDNHVILSNTVSTYISEGYDKLLNYQLCYIRPSQEDAKVESVFLPQVAKDLKMGRLVYFMYNNSRNETGFTTSCSYDKTFHAGSTIVLTIPSFNLFITGDLSFYANVLGSEPGSYTAEK